MKRRVLAVFALFLCLLPLVGFTEGQKVYDNAGLLTDSQRAELEEYCLAAAKQLEFDIVLLTIEDAEGKSSMEYADDFYDRNGFGYDAPQGDGVLCLIDMDNRNVWISTCGRAIEEIDDYTVDRMLENLYPALTGGDYYGAFGSFLNDMVDYKAIKEPYRSPGGYNPPKPSPETDFYVDDGKGGYAPAYPRQSFNHSIALIAGAVAALIVVIIMVKTAGGNNSAVSPKTYLNHSATRMNYKNDQFTHKTVTMRYIPPPPPPSTGGGGGGSSSHTSSGGVSHGGGGRSF